MKNKLKSKWESFNLTDYLSGSAKTNKNAFYFINLIIYIAAQLIFPFEREMRIHYLDTSNKFPTVQMVSSNGKMTSERKKVQPVLLPLC